MGDIKYLTRSNRNVPLGELRMCDMEVFLMPHGMPMTKAEFDYLPIYGFESQAPVHKSLWKTKGLCRFKIPVDNEIFKRDGIWWDDGISWYIGKPVSRRRMKCWKAHFPPSISYKEEAASAMVHAVSTHVPEMAGRFGTLVGAELLSCALNCVDTDTLRQWLKYREQQESS